MYSEKQMREQEKQDAKLELVQIKAMKILLKENIFAAEIKICGMSFGVCDNKTLIPALDDHEAEIKKYLKGEKNNYE